jgi:hypothetical protein
MAGKRVGDNNTQLFR